MDVNVALLLFPVFYLVFAFTLVAFCAGLGLAVASWRASHTASWTTAKPDAPVNSRCAA